MQTFTALMPSSRRAGACGSGSAVLGRTRSRALVLLELLAVLAILAMLTSLAAVSLTGKAFRSSFEQQASDFMNVLKMAQNAAAESDRRYAVMLDLDEKTYVLKPFVELDMDGIPAGDEIMHTGYFTEDFQLEYVRFDDGQDTRNAELRGREVYRVWLLAGHAGWQSGAQIGVLDTDGTPYTILVNRFSRVIQLHAGEYPIMEPVQDVPF